MIGNFQGYVLQDAWIPGKAYRTSRSAGYCGTGVQNSQMLRAGTEGAVPVPRKLWHGAYRPHRSLGFGYECPTELTEARVRL